MNRFKEWRLRTRHTQQEVAEMLGLALTTISRHELGLRVPNQDTILAYARLYKIPTYALFYDPASTALAAPNRVRELRTASSLTQDQLAAAVGVADHVVRYWEAGSAEFTHEDIIKLGRVFHVPTYQIFFHNEFEPTPLEKRSFDVDTFAAEYEVDPLAVFTTGDRGTPYAEFEGGYAAQQLAGTAL